MEDSGLTMFYYILTKLLIMWNLHTTPLRKKKSLRQVGLQLVMLWVPLGETKPPSLAIAFNSLVVQTTTLAPIGLV